MFSLTTQIKSDLTENDFGANVSIPVDGTEFTVPSDGYATFYAQYGSNYIYANILGATSGSFTVQSVSSSQGGSATPVFVRKGMKIKVTNKSNEAWAIFNPLT